MLYNFLQQGVLDKLRGIGEVDNVSGRLGGCWKGWLKL
jgi:hypothetical protein